jgi:hypothetical protein
VRDESGVSTEPTQRTKPESNTEPTQHPAFPGQISDDEIRQSYRPDPSIQTEIWDIMFSKIKVTDVEETIRDPV